MIKHPLAKPALRIAKNEASVSPAAPSDADRPGVADPRLVWIVSDPFHPWMVALRDQLRFFGFQVQRADWNDSPPDGPSPLAILFIPASGYRAGELGALRRIHALHPASRVVCLAVPELMDPILALMRAGADVMIPIDQKTSTVLAHVLNLTELQAQEPYRVLVVEDSPTAIAIITRALSRHGIDSHPVSNPEQLLKEIVRYRPDLVLMDVNMPHCSGIEATRILRQIPACQSLPVVYLSGETDAGVQDAALRMGGDQFINKPFNPVLLATVVKTKIQRYRALQRPVVQDGLTGLLNHTAASMRLGQMVGSYDRARDKLCAVLLDIDQMTAINAAHGHLVGDQVIRNLGWLLKGRLRTSDIIGRYCGATFLIGLRGIGQTEAYPILDRIRQDFTSLPHTYAGTASAASIAPGSGGTLNASFSAGVAAYPDFYGEQELIDAAQAALARAKAQGRNRIEQAG